jgi:hypothetical protein
MDQITAAVLGLNLGLNETRRTATSALPCAPVLPEPKRRHRVMRQLRGVSQRRG